MSTSARPSTPGLARPARHPWRALRRLWPHGLAAQLLIGLVLGLALTHGAGLLLLSREPGEVHGLARRQAVDQLVQIAQGAWALEDLRAVDRVLAALGGPHSRYRLVEGPATALPEALSAPSDPRWAEDAATVSRELGQRLELPPDGLRVRISAPEGSDTEAPPRARMDAAVALPSGAWLVAEHGLGLRTRWWWPFSFWMQLGLVPFVLIACIAVQRLLRPVHALVQAAQQASVGEWVPPLEPSGPREVREVIRAFNLMQERLRRFVDDRTRLLASVSHDLRTPITSLRLRVEMVEDEALRAPMVRTLDDMAALVDESLRFGRDEAAREPTRPVSLAALVQGVVETQRSLGRDVRLEALPADDSTYRCRPLALQRALGNLVDNAVRYGQRARVRLLAPEAGSAAAASWRIEVDDDGPGIPPDRVEQAFLPFTQLQRGPSAPDGAQGGPDGAGESNGAGEAAAARQAPGTGLGLAIARSCSRAHGGEVQLRRAPGGGLRAVLLLPSLAPLPPLPEAEAYQAQRRTGRASSSPIQARAASSVRKTS